MERNETVTPKRPQPPATNRRRGAPQLNLAILCAASEKLRLAHVAGEDRERDFQPRGLEDAACRLSRFAEFGHAGQRKSNTRAVPLGRSGITVSREYLCLQGQQQALGIAFRLRPIRCSSCRRSLGHCIAPVCARLTPRDYAGVRALGECGKSRKGVRYADDTQALTPAVGHPSPTRGEGTPLAARR